MNKIVNIITILMDIDANPKKAGLIAGLILGGVLLVCAMALIFKKILLNRKYKADEEFVKEYKQKLKNKEFENKKVTGEVTEDF